MSYTSDLIVPRSVSNVEREVDATDLLAYVSGYDWRESATSTRGACSTNNFPTRLNAGRIWLATLLLGLLFSLFAVTAGADDSKAENVETQPVEVITAITLKQGEASVVHRGRVLIQAQDGSALLERTDGQLIAVKPDELVSSIESEQPFQYIPPAALGAQLKQELGPSFDLFETEHYVMVTDAGPVYAEWCGRLLERLHDGFYSYWNKAGLELSPLSMKLPVILFADQKAFQTYAVADAGEALAQARGYYSARTNRIVLTDLREADGGVAAREDRDVAKKIEASPLNVATVIHEATHQIAFNCGLHVRYADNPLWLTEGLAIYCESPDLKNRSGWRTLGILHRDRLKAFEDYVKNRRPAGSLVTLLEGGDRFRDPSKVIDAYAESWAFTYFLMRRHKEEYITFLKNISRKRPLDWSTQPARLDEFRQVFGNDLDALEKEFLIYIRRL
ncbi:MAG: DUF1570 domain-containing protein [Planctomycetaceae bacterium]